MNRKISDAILEFFFSTRAQCLGCGDEQGCDCPFLCSECLALLKPSYVSASREEWRRSGLSSVRFVYYYGRPIRGLIRAFKFRGVKILAKNMAQDMNELLTLRGHADADVIIPVPLHPTRLRNRGYNQSEVLARALSEKCGIPVRTDILRRIRKTRQQSKLSHAKRRNNLKNAFVAVQNISGLRVLLLDDVITTGSTVCACAEALRAAGAADVHAISIAGVHARHRSEKTKIYRQTVPQKKIKKSHFF